MDLWERTTALDRLDALLGGIAGRGRVALVAGEAGLGKSALVAEFARRCGARARVLWGGCDRLVTPRALGPLHDEAIAWGERAEALAERLGDVETAVHAAINVNSARVNKGEVDALAGLEAAHERAAAHGSVEQAVRALLCLSGSMADELAQYTMAAEVIERALDYAREQDLDGYMQYLVGARASLRMQRGDWAGALADADEALARSGQFAVTAVLPLVARGRIQSARGHPAALSTLDDAARHAERIGETQWMAPVAAARAEYFLWRGELDRAAAEARHGIAGAAAVWQPFQLGALAYRLWQATGTEPAQIVIAEPYRLMMRGDWAEAAARWAARGAELLRVEALSAGDQAATAEALAVLDGLGATRAAGHLRGRLRQRGFARIPRGPRRATAANVAGLTGRQADVLALLAEGRSNADIAARLVLSPRTVEYHISALFAKLGVANRGQAGAVARRLGVTDQGQVLDRR